MSWALSLDSIYIVFKYRNLYMLALKLNIYIYKIILYFLSLNYVSFQIIPII